MLGGAYIGVWLYTNFLYSTSFLRTVKVIVRFRQDIRMVWTEIKLWNTRFN